METGFGIGRSAQREPRCTGRRSIPKNGRLRDDRHLDPLVCWGDQLNTRSPRVTTCMVVTTPRIFPLVVASGMSGCPRTAED